MQYSAERDFILFPSVVLLNGLLSNHLQDSLHVLSVLGTGKMPHKLGLGQTDTSKMM